MLDPYEVIRQRREEMAQEAQQNRLAEELRRSRRKRAGDRGWASALTWESRRIAGRLIKLVKSKDAG